MTINAQADTQLIDQSEQVDPDAVRQSQLPKKKSSRKSLIGLIIVIIIMICFFIGAWHWWTEGRFIETTDDAYVGGDTTVISPKVPGYIAAVKVTDNQVVHAGDLLIQLDDRDYLSALARAEGAVMAQNALIANLDATHTLQQSIIDQSRATLQATQAETNRAAQEEHRYQRLVGNAAVSLASAQKATADYQQAIANQQKAQAALKATEEGNNVIYTQRQQALAALAQATADRDMAKLNLSYTELRAPVDGIIGNRRARNGAYAAAAIQLLSIVPAHGLWVDANFKESQLSKLQPGQSVNIEADVLANYHFHGHVESLAPATGAQFSVLPPENATGNFTKIVQRVPVRIIIEEPENNANAKNYKAHTSLLRPGLSVKVSVDTRPKRSTS